MTKLPLIKLTLGSVYTSKVPRKFGQIWINLLRSHETGSSVMFTRDQGKSCVTAKPQWSFFNTYSCKQGKNMNQLQLWKTISVEIFSMNPIQLLSFALYTQDSDHRANLQEIRKKSKNECCLPRQFFLFCYYLNCSLGRPRTKYLLHVVSSWQNLFSVSSFICLYVAVCQLSKTSLLEFLS